MRRSSTSANAEHPYDQACSTIFFLSGDCIGNSSELEASQHTYDIASIGRDDLNIAEIPSFLSLLVFIRSASARCHA